MDDDFDVNAIAGAFVDVDPLEFEEAQLAAAIAASLADSAVLPPIFDDTAASTPPKLEQSLFHASESESSDNEVELVAVTPARPKKTEPRTEVAVDEPDVAEAPPPVFLSERARMEQERIARRALKRPREEEEEIAPVPTQTPGAGPSKPRLPEPFPCLEYERPSKITSVLANI